MPTKKPQTTSLATTVQRYPALLSPRAVTLSMDQLPFISGGKVSFRVRMPSATSLGLPGKSRVTLVPWRWLLMRSSWAVVALS
ncbi:hypothetical protein [Marinomonas arctica]|uniref:Uncharacterized protein n=1 Tax=Marinomonas arctica TaxID=383750 RepID=A0A7H1J1H6_9GAMM|nr:hypothetical protein [Marinomonas arctica]QNT04342.1 hypothetical protein IBG28_11350 [Marinomonas arctica]